MMKKNLDPLTMMGFARYEKLDGVETEELIDACLNWRRKFLAHQNGNAMHCFLGNLKGHFADAIMTVDQSAMEEMAKRHPDDESSRTFISLLNPDSIRLTGNVILKHNVGVPTDFSCIEFGTFRPQAGIDFSERAMLEAARKIETGYLVNHPDSRAHFMDRINAETYSEVAFVKTLGAARKICQGYLVDDACGDLLAMFDPESVDLDFWHVLA